MKPSDVLPDSINSVQKNGLTIRKGTIGAFTVNLEILEKAQEGDEEYREAEADLLSLVPALKELRFFDFYDLKSERAKKIIQKNFPGVC